MIKYKLAAVVLSGSLAATGIGLISVAKLNIQHNLTITNKNVTNYVNNVDNTLNKSESYIKSEKNENQTLISEINKLKIENKTYKNKLSNEESQNTQLQNKISSVETENNKLQTQNKNLNNKVIEEQEKTKALMQTISTLEGSSKFKNMTKTQQMNVLSTLLHCWGYGKWTSKAIANILSGSFWYAVPHNQFNSNIHINKSLENNNQNINQNT